MLFRLAAVLLLIATTAGCGQFGVAGPGDLGLEAKLTSPAGDLLVVSDDRLLTAPDPYNRTIRNAILSRWLIRSDNLCGNYQFQLSRAIRDSRLGTDVLATILSGLATILAPAATKTALAGAATMTLGVGGAIQSDLFMQQAGEVVSTAIQAVRTRARNDLEKKFQAPYAVYTLEQGLVDVQRYDRETCSLNVGLNEIRASLNLGGAAASQVNNPIVPLPPQLPFGADFAGAAPPPAAMATTIVPPITTNLPGGGVAIIPGKVISTPVAPPVVTPPPPPVMPAPPAVMAAPPLPIVPPGQPPRPRVRTVRPPHVLPGNAVARSRLFVAVGSGPEGRNPPDPRLRGLMTQCWKELLNPAPTNFSIWARTATPQTLDSVTDCINRKAAASPAGGS